MSANRVKFTDLRVSEPYTLSDEYGYKVIKIGDPNYTLKGQKNYEITYLYNLGKDTSKKYDELYFNLIGDEWDTSISNITFTIIMPKAFDESKLGFSTGRYGSTDSSNITYSVNGNVITGSLNKKLNPGEALTVRLELPDAYFVGASSNIDLIMIFSLILPIIFATIGYCIWKKYGKDDPFVETVEFYPPEGFNSLEVAYLYKGKATSEDVVSLLIYLANKGYFKISKIEENFLSDLKENFKFIKLKEYDGDNLNEKILFEGIFNKNTTIVNSVNKVIPFNNEVSSFALIDNFYITIEKILDNINDKENKDKIFEKVASSKKIILILLAAATYCVMTMGPFISVGYIGSSIFALIPPVVGIVIMVNFLFAKKVICNRKLKKATLTVKLCGIIFGYAFLGIPWVQIILPVLKLDYIYLIIYVNGVICLICLIICIKFSSKRTKYGNEMLGKIKGFKKFLETAEKDKLEEIVMKNPTYFYDILPYTYVLGVSDKWIEKFGTTLLQCPDWYESNLEFNVLTFLSFMNNTMSVTESFIASSPSYSSGSSGGGFSGGGSGGGGGGSW